MGNLMSEKFTNNAKITRAVKVRMKPSYVTEYRMHLLGILPDDSQKHAKSQNYKEVKKIIRGCYKANIARILEDMKADEYALNNTLIEELYECTIKAPNKEFDGKTSAIAEQNCVRKIAEELAAIIGKIRKTYDSDYHDADGEITPKRILDYISKKDTISETEQSVLNEYQNQTTNLRSITACYDAHFQTNKISIPSRVVENMQVFFKNLSAIARIVAVMTDTDVAEVTGDTNITLSALVEKYNVKQFYSQNDIDAYNSIINRLNQFSNLYSQQNHTHLPKCIKMNSQILYNVDEEAEDFACENMEEVLRAVNRCKDRFLVNALHSVENLCNSWNPANVYVAGSNAIHSLSVMLFGGNGVHDLTQKCHLDSAEEYTVETIDNALRENDVHASVRDAILQSVDELKGKFCQADGAYTGFCNKYGMDYFSSQKLLTNHSVIADIMKAMLDFKSLNNFISCLECSDESFNQCVTSIDDFYHEINLILCSVRKYLQTKPDSKTIQLDFGRGVGNSSCRSRMCDSKHMIVKHIEDNRFYLVYGDFCEPESKIRTQNPDLLFPKVPVPYCQSDDSDRAIVVQKCTKTPKGAWAAFCKIFLSKQSWMSSKYDYISAETRQRVSSIVEAYKQTKVSPSREDLEFFVEFLRGEFFAEHYEHDIQFLHKPLSEYATMQDVLNDVDAHPAFNYRFFVSWDKMVELEKQGKIMIFEMDSQDIRRYRKDPSKKVNKNFSFINKLFDESNISDVLYNGNMSVSFRPAVYKESYIHRAGEPIKRKNGEGYSIKNFDIRKDNRFCEDQFEATFVVSAYVGSNDSNKELNLAVQDAFNEASHRLIISGDLGERNPVTMVVRDADTGVCYEIKHLNQFNGHDYRIDFDNAKRDIKQSQRDCNQIMNFNNLMTGYCGYVVDEFVKTWRKYASKEGYWVAFALENLSTDFARGRAIGGTSVYTKVLDRLTQKLTYLTFDDAKDGGVGNIAKGLQLANPAGTQYVKSAKEHISGGTDNHVSQNGIIYLVKARNTSISDPTTGFNYTNAFSGTNRGKINCDESIEETKKFFSKHISSIKYNPTTSYYEVQTDNWLLETYGDRLDRSTKPEKSVNLTESFDILFSRTFPDFDSHSGEDILPLIMEIRGKAFFDELRRLLNLLIQTRNFSMYRNGESNCDYIVSPVRNATGKFFDSRLGLPNLPTDGDENGAFNIGGRLVLAFSKSTDTLEEYNKHWYENQNCKPKS